MKRVYACYPLKGNFRYTCRGPTVFRALAPVNRISLALSDEFYKQLKFFEHFCLGLFTKFYSSCRQVTQNIFILSDWVNICKNLFKSVRLLIDISCENKLLIFYSKFHEEIIVWNCLDQRRSRKKDNCIFLNLNFWLYCFSTA